MELSDLTRYFWTKSPQEYWQRLFGSPPSYRPWALGKHRQWNRLPFYLQMFRACADRAGHPLQFGGKRVLEIGAGPVLGLIPFALLEGAGESGIIEPDYREIRNQRGFQDEYLYPLFHLYNQVLGKGTPGRIEDFMVEVQRVRIEQRTLEEIGQSNPPYDVVLSKSCLEHIADLPRAVQASHTISAAGSLHIHYIDFSMHYTRDQLPGNTFGKTYHQARADNPEYLANPGGIVNLLRHSEMLAMFRAHFAEVHFFPSIDYRDRIQVLNLSTRHADWRGFEESDLGVAQGVLLAIR